MLQRFKNSLALFDQSLNVLSDHKKLLVFPIVTMVATAFIALFFLSGFILQPTGYAYSDKAHWTVLANQVFTRESLDRIKSSQNGTEAEREDAKNQLQLNQIGVVLAAGIYFLSMFLATFFNVAFYHEIMEGLAGRRVSVRSGLAFAVSRLPAIFLWSMFAGLIGYLIKQIEQRVGLVGKIVVNLIGLAWSVAAVFSIPVIVCEGKSNPVQVLKSSAMSLKKAWGETLVGFLGFQFTGILAILTSFVPLILCLSAAAMLNMPELIAVGFVSWIAFLFVFVYVSSVAGHIYQCALYVFAASGSVPPGYTREMMNLAWKHKKVK